MAKYLIQGETLTEIANAVRTLNGTEGVMAPSEMQSSLEGFNSDMSTVVSEQDSLIEQITTALGSKVVPSGPEIETCTITLFRTGLIEDPVTLYYLDKDLEIQSINPLDFTNSPSNTIEVVKNSIIASDYGFMDESESVQIITGDIYNVKSGYITKSCSISFSS